MQILKTPPFFPLFCRRLIHKRGSLNLPKLPQKSNGGESVSTKQFNRSNMISNIKINLCCALLDTLSDLNYCVNTHTVVKFDDVFLI